VEYQAALDHHEGMTMPRTRLQTKALVITVASSRSRLRSNLPCLAAALVTSVLMWQSYFPIGFGQLAWIALAPWLMLVRADLPNRRRYLFAWLGGFAFFFPALSWMRTGYSEMVVFWVLLSIYCASYWVGSLWLLRRLDQRTRLPLTLTVPLVWTAMEYARGTLMGGFSFYFLGHTQQAFLPAIQVADLAGVWTVTALIAAVNGLLAETANNLTRIRGWFGVPAPQSRIALRPQALGIAGILLLTFAYGGWRLSQSEFAAGPRVALLQPSIAQTERNAASVADAGDRLAQESIDVQMLQLTKQAVRVPDRPDLVIWPETTFPWEQKEVAAGAPEGPELAEWRQDIPDRVRLAHDAAEYAGTNVLLGLNTRVYGVDGRVRRTNSALLLKPNGDAVGRYDKMHLVPFGEYIPLKDVFPFVQKFSPYGANDYTISPGDEQTRFPLTVGDRTYHFGVLICYEDAVPGLASRLVSASPVDFIVNISNDGWFMGSSEHAEHLAVSRFRAVESRRALLRAVNGGVSAVIDGNGRVVASPAESWAASHSVTSVVTAAVPLDTRGSIYARLGDVLPWTCWGLLLVGCCLRPKS
jgi:apolipoprotein N-acyltransferase